MHKKDGTGRVTYNISTILFSQYSEEFDFTVLVHKSILSKMRNKFPEVHFFSQKLANINVFRVLYDFTLLNYQVNKFKTDIYVSFESFTIPLFSKCKKITYIHDLIQIKFGGYINLYSKIWFIIKSLQAQRYADLIITVSQFSKDEILDTFPKLNEDKVLVLYPSISPQFESFLLNNTKAISNSKKQTNKSRPKFNGENNIRQNDRNLIICLGGFDKRKNNSFAVSGFIKYLSEHKDSNLKMAIVGINGLSTRKTKSVKPIIPIKYKKYFELYSEINDKTLSYLYYRSKIAICSSVYEGFGLPIIEAQFFGIPVISVKSSSLVEAAGKGAVFVENNDVDSLSEAIDTLSTDTTKRNKLTKLGAENIKRFSWNDDVLKLVNIFKTM